MQASPCARSSLSMLRGNIKKMVKKDMGESYYQSGNTHVSLIKLSMRIKFNFICELQGVIKSCIVPIFQSNFCPSAKRVALDILPTLATCSNPIIETDRTDTGLVLRPHIQKCSGFPQFSSSPPTDPHFEEGKLYLFYMLRTRIIMTP